MCNTLALQHLLPGIVDSILCTYCSRDGGMAPGKFHMSRVEYSISFKKAHENQQDSHTIHVWYIYLHLHTFTIIYHEIQPNVGKYSSPMDGFWICKQNIYTLRISKGNFSDLKKPIELWSDLMRVN